MRFKGLALILALLPVVTWANAPTASLRPEMRPGTEQATTPSRRVTTTLRAVIPQPRPRAHAPVPAPEPEPERRLAAASSNAVPNSLIPNRRPLNIAKLFRKAAREREATSYRPTSKFGKICGDSTIRGQNMAPIPGKLKGCGVARPVKVYEVDGIKLTTPSTINCTTAKALKTWINNSVKPAVGGTGGGVASLKVAAHYACRTRNNRPGAKISEHGRGNAIDISAINLRDGTALTVLRGWRDRRQGPILKKVHRGACGPFGTVLGPNSDRYHQDHFHFDVARHRGGAYCR